MNDLVLHPQEPNPFPTLNLEDPQMIANFVTTLANALVRASELMQVVKNLQHKLEEVEAKAEAAFHQKEIADAAYNSVNAQRIDAENQVISLRSERVALERDNQTLTLELGDIKARVVDLEAEVLKVRNEYEERIAALTNSLTAANERAQDHLDLYNMAESDKANMQITLRGVEKERDDLRFDNAALKDANAKLQEMIDKVQVALHPVKLLKLPTDKPANSHWESQPRNPAGQSDGGRWASDKPNA